LEKSNRKKNLGSLFASRLNQLCPAEVNSQVISCPFRRPFSVQLHSPGAAMGIAPTWQATRIKFHFNESLLHFKR